MIIFLILFLDQCQKKKELENNYTSINNWRDSTTLVLNDQYAKNSSLTTSNISAFLEIKNLKGEKRALQEFVRKDKNTIAALRSTIRTQIEVTTKNVTVDSNSFWLKQTFDGTDSNIVRWPTYEFVENNEWYTIYGKVNPDSAIISLETSASVNYKYTYKRTAGLFSLKEPVVEATVDNPYVNFESLESWSQKPKPPRMSWGLSAGIGMSADFQPVIAVVVGPSFRFRDW